MDPSSPGSRYRTTWERNPTSPASTLSPSTPSRRTRNASEGVAHYLSRTDGSQPTRSSRSSESFLAQGRESTTEAPESPLYERNLLHADIDNYHNTPTRARRTSPTDFDPTLPLNNFSPNKSPKTPRRPSKEKAILDGSLHDGFHDGFQDGSLAESNWDLLETPKKSVAMGPLSTGRRRQYTLFRSSSSFGRIGEVDPHSATTSPVVRRDPGWIFDTPSKVGRSPVTPRALSVPSDINEWMADFETPPRKATENEPHKIRERLYGFLPKITEPVPQTSSQEGSFYSAQSSIIGEDDDHENGQNVTGDQGDQGNERGDTEGDIAREHSPGASSARKPSSQNYAKEVETPIRPQDAPSPLVQDMDQAQLSPVISVESPNAREEVQSSDDMFAEITSSAIHRAFGKSESASQNGDKSQGKSASQRLSRTSGDVSMHHINSEDIEGLLEPWTLSSHGSNRSVGTHVKHQFDQGLEDAYEDDFADLDGDNFDLHAFTQSPVKSRTSAHDRPVTPVNENLETNKDQEGFRDDNVTQAPDFIFKPATVSNSATAKWAKLFQGEDDDYDVMSTNGTSGPLPGFGKFQAPSFRRTLPKQSDESSHVSGNKNPSPRAPLGPTDEIRDVAPPQFQGFGRFRGNNTFEPMGAISKEAQERAARLFDDEDDGDSLSHFHTSPTESQKRPLPGFTTGHMKPVMPVSREKMEKFSKFFDDDFGANDRSEPLRPPPSFGGFSIASGKSLPKISESALSKAANILEINEAPEVSVSRPGHDSFMGFSTAKNNGKTFVPITISKAAQERALSVLEMEEPISKPEPSGSLRGKISLNFNNRPSAPILASSRNEGAPSIAPTSALSLPVLPSLPVLSSHMNNLKNKSLRSSSKMTTALPGALKPLSRSTQFKPPLMANNIGHSHQSIAITNDKTNASSKPFGGLVGRKQIGKRALHPNARPIFVNSPQVQVAKAPMQYRSLFNLEGSQ